MDEKDQKVGSFAEGEEEMPEKDQKVGSFAEGEEEE
jgi:hypothetical protein